MPRLPHSELLRAYSISPLLPLVLRGSRCLPSATNELRWLKEHVKETSKTHDDAISKRHSLLQLCHRRAKGEPLQYILGSQPFGELDIKCRPGVLIPRPETEAYTAHLATLLVEDRLHEYITSNFKPGGTREVRSLKILDLCSGSGCISLLLLSLLSKRFRRMQIQGWDLSRDAVLLARENLRQNILAGNLPIQTHITTRFDIVDIFDPIAKLSLNQLTKLDTVPSCDIIVSNPPYISQDSFNKETTRSVRIWEPRLALVPGKTMGDSRFAAEDVFYRRLMELHNQFKSKILLMEVGDDAQALRVAEMAVALPEIAKWNRIQIWRGSPDLLPDLDEPRQVVIYGQNVSLIGSGKFRSVILLRQEPVQESGNMVQFTDSVPDHARLS